LPVTEISTPAVGAGTPRRRGRPRDARVDALILETTLELIADGGVAHLSMDQVAQRAGVGKATIYRRWESKEALLLDALRSALEPFPNADTGSLRGDLESFLGEVVRRYRETQLSDILPHLIEVSYYDPGVRGELEDYFRHRQQPLREMLARGISRGELTGATSEDDIDVLVSVLIGPFTYRRMFTHQDVDEAFAARLLDLVLR
jgi:AcrR family transcriptional regulator